MSGTFYEQEEVEQSETTELQANTKKNQGFIFSTFETKLKSKEWIPKSDEELLRLLGTSNIGNHTEKIDWSPGHVEKHDGLVAVTEPYVDSLILRHLIDARHCKGSHYMYASELQKSLTEVIRDFSVEGSEETFSFSGLKNRVDVKLVGMANVSEKERNELQQHMEFLDRVVFKYSGLSDGSMPELRWINIKLGCPNNSFTFVREFLHQSSSLRTRGFMLKDIDVTCDYAGTIDFEAMRFHMQKYLGFGQVETQLHKTDVTQTPKLANASTGRTCIQFYHNVDSYLVRTKLYLTIARHIESSSVRKRTGHRISEWILCSKDTRMGQVKEATEYTGTIRIESTIHCNKTIEFDSAPIFTDIQLLKKPDSWFEQVLESTRSMVPDSFVYCTPHKSSVEAWLKSLHHTLIIADLESDKALIVHSYNADTDKLCSTSISKWSDHESDIKKYHPFGKLPIDVIEINKRSPDNPNAIKQPFPEWARELDCFKNCKDQFMTPPITAEHDDYNTEDDEMEDSDEEEAKRDNATAHTDQARITKHMRDMDEGELQLSDPFAALLPPEPSSTPDTLPPVSNASVVSMKVDRHEYVSEGSMNVYCYRLNRFRRRPYKEVKSESFQPSMHDGELPLPRTRLHVPESSAYYKEVKSLTYKEQQQRIKQSGFGSHVDFEFEFDKSPENEDFAVYTTRGSSIHIPISVSSIKFSPGMQVLQKYQDYVNACKESNQTTVSRGIWLRERLEKARAKQRLLASVSVEYQTSMRETDEQNLRQDMLNEDFRGFLRRESHRSNTNLGALAAGEHTVVAIWRHHDSNIPNMHQCVFPYTAKHTLFLLDTSADSKSKIVAYNATADLNRSLSHTYEVSFVVLSWDRLPEKSGYFAFDCKNAGAKSSIGQLLKTDDGSNTRKRVKTSHQTGGPATDLDVAIRLQLNKRIVYESESLLSAERQRKLTSSLVSASASASASVTDSCNDNSTADMLPILDLPNTELQKLDLITRTFKEQHPSGFKLKLLALNESGFRCKPPAKRMCIQACIIDAAGKTGNAYNFWATPNLEKLIREQVSSQKTSGIHEYPESSSVIIVKKLGKSDGKFAIESNGSPDWEVPRARELDTFACKIDRDEENIGFACKIVNGEKTRLELSNLWIQEIKEGKARDGSTKRIFRGNDNNYYILRDERWWKGHSKNEKGKAVAGVFDGKPGYGLDLRNWKSLPPRQSDDSASSICSPSASSALPDEEEEENEHDKMSDIEEYEDCE